MIERIAEGALGLMPKRKCQLSWKRHSGKDPNIIIMKFLLQSVSDYRLLKVDVVSTHLIAKRENSLTRGNSLIVKCQLWSVSQQILAILSISLEYS